MSYRFPFSIHLTTNTAAITTTQTQILALSIPANFLKVGSTIHGRLFGTCTGVASGVSTIRVRYGPTTLTGNIAVSLAPTQAAGTAVFTVEFIATVRTVGATGTVTGSMVINNVGVVGISNAAVAAASTGTTVVVDTTAVNLVEITAVMSSASANVTFHTGLLEVNKQ